MGKTRIGDLVSDNLISTDIGNDRVGIGSTLPSSKLDVSGDVKVSGVVTTSKLHVDPVGSGFTYTEDLVVLGNARVTGILSIGTSSIVLDANAKTIRGVNEIRIDSDEDDDTPVIFRQRRGRAFFRKTRRNHSNQLIEVEEEASVGIGTTVSVNTSGIITATSFYGDGSNLTGLTHSQVSGVMVNLVEDTTPQLGGNLDLNSNDITGTGNINITGSGTFSGNVSIAGTLTYEDVTNVDSVGLITARSGVDVTGNISVTGTVDGRDIASDGSKLDGIESGATADQTAAEILTLIKTVDGSGSGLDADTLDNLGSGAFLRSNAADTATGNITFRDNILFFDNTTFSTFDWQNYQADGGDLTWTVGGTSGPEMELESDGSNYLNAELRVGGSKVWTAGNDGSGSGLDADTLDGVNSGSFLRSDANDTLSAIITGHASDTEVFRLRSSTHSTKYIYYGGWSTSNSNDISRIRTSSNLHIDSAANGNLYLNYYAANRTIYLGNTGQTVRAAGTNIVWHAGNDGAGSGLDADLLDGISSASFLRSDTSDTYSSGTLTFGTGTALDLATNDVYASFRVFRNSKSGSDGLFMGYGNNNSGLTRIYGGGSTSTHLSVSSSGMTFDSNTIWHAGNDGSGSGLDADTVDGIQGASFLRSDASDTASGVITFTNTSTNSTLNVTGNPGAASYNFFLAASNDTGNKATHFVNGSTRTADGGANAYTIRNDGGSFILGRSSQSTILYGSGDLTYNSNEVWHAGNDGAGSGLDADTVDTLHASSFLRSDANDTFTGTITGNSDSTNPVLIIDGAGPNIIRFPDNGSNTLGIDLVYRTTPHTLGFEKSTNGAKLWETDCDDGRTTFSFDPYKGSNKIWHAGNDGSGSGLDADTVDGLQASSFLRSDTASEITAPLTIDSDNNQNGALRIENLVTDTNNDFYFAQEIIQTLSGSQAATSDREQGGIYMDINSTNTGGDTSNEHRAYGIYIDLDSTGDADSITGIYVNATSTPTTGTISNIYGGYFFSEDNGGAGAVSTVYGVQAFAYSDNIDSDTNTQFGGYFKSYCAADSAAVGTAYGVYGEIEINGTTDLYGSCFAFSAVIDNNTNVAQTNTSYLFYGNYAGTFPTTAYGVYINNNVPSYFGGGIEIPDGPGTIAGSNFNAGWLRIGTSSLGWAFDSNELITFGDCIFGSASGSTLSFTNRPAFNGGASGSTSPFTVDSTQVVTNLNADLLDGIQGSSYLRSDANDTYTGTLTGAGNINFTGSNIEIGNGSGSVAMTINDGYGNANLCFNHGFGVPDVNGNALRIETNVDSTTTAQFIFEGKSNVTANSAVALTELFKMTETGATCLGQTVWTAGNDGSGSGLDADTLDGIQGSALAPIDSPTFTGNLTIPGSIIHAGDTDTYIQFHGDNLFRVVINGAEVQEWGNNYTLLSDSDQLRLGTGSDFRMQFNGADTIFRNYAHANGDIIFQGETSGGTNQNILIMKTDSTRTYNVLYENNAERLRTVSTGVDITGALVATGDVTAFSDITLKEDVEVIPNALDKVSQIRGVTFTRKDFEDKSRKSGVIAQEVEKVLPEVVTTNEDGIKTVAYGNMVGLLIEAVKEQQKQIDDLKAKLEEGN